jgi:hypothetical protein
MGRTLQTITQLFEKEMQAITRFRRALRRTDQLALDDLLGHAKLHLAAASYATDVMPTEMFLLAMLLEEHKIVIHLQDRVEELEKRLDLQK